MSDKSNIEWTDATWNPVVGCSIVSPGCTNCYAMKMAARIQKMNRTGGSNSNYVNHYDGTTENSKAGPVWTSKIAIAPDKLFLKPLSWKSPRKVFVNSMGDLFHESIPDEWIDRVFAVMALCPQHQFQVLTKRAERMRDYFAGIATDQGLGLNRFGIAALWTGLVGPGGSLPGWPLPNIWIGVSAERQEEANERIPHLLQTPATVRFVSLEPLLGPINLTAKAAEGYKGSADWFPGLDWVIVGGESGRGARPVNPEWVRSLRDQCGTAGVPFFFKQWGEHQPAELMNDGRPEPWRKTPEGGTIWEIDELGTPPSSWPQVKFYRVGKKRAGRILDGIEHNGFPELRA